MTARHGVACAVQVLCQVPLHHSGRLERHRVQVGVEFRHQAYAKAFDYGAVPAL